MATENSLYLTNSWKDPQHYILNLRKEQNSYILMLPRHCSLTSLTDITRQRTRFSGATTWMRQTYCSAHDDGSTSAMRNCEHMDGQWVTTDQCQWVTTDQCNAIKDSPRRRVVCLSYQPRVLVTHEWMKLNYYMCSVYFCISETSNYAVNSVVTCK